VWGQGWSKIQRNIKKPEVCCCSPWNAPEPCTIEPYNRMEVVTWGFDSGIFSTIGGVSLYAEPDGDIWTKVHLEEFTVKKFTGQSLCTFEGLNGFSSVDFHWSGGPSDSNCGTCTVWKIADPIDWEFTFGGNPVQAVQDVYVYDSITTDMYDKNTVRVYTDGGCISECQEVINYSAATSGLAYLLPESYTPDGTEDTI